MATYYLSDTDVTAGVFDTLTESAPSAADSTSGWTVGKNASPDMFKEWHPDVLLGRMAFGTEPSAFTQFGYRTTATLSGDFANTAWTLYGSVVNDASYSAQDGIVGFRLWRSVNADGSSATQITSAWQDSGTISFASGSDPQAFNIGVSPGAVTLTNEYLFLEVEWECTVSGGNNGANVYWTHNDGTQRLVTPTFTAAASSKALAGTLTAAGGGTAAGTDVAPLSGTLTAVGGGTAAGTDVAPLSGTLTAAGGGTAAGTVESSLSSTLTAIGGGIAAGIIVAALSVTLAIVGGGTAAGTIVSPLSGTLTATGGGTAAGTSVHPLAGTLTATGGGTASGVVRTPGEPIVRYLFEDDVVDHRDNHHGTATSITYTAAGRDGKAAVFNGSNANSNIGDVPELSSANWTITHWLAPTAIDADGDIFRKYVNASNNLLIDQSSSGSGRIVLQIVQSGSTALGLFGTSGLTAGTWNHFSWAYDGAGVANADRLKLYINGVLQTLTFVGTVPATIGLGGSDATIGAASSSFAGNIDDFRIYSISLTQPQVEAVRLEALPRGNRLRRSHYLPFDERGFWETAVVSAATPLAGTLTIVGGGTAAGLVESPLSGTLAIVGGGTAAGADVAPLSGTLTLVGGGTAAGTVEDPLSGTLAIVGGGTAAGVDVAPLSGTLTITGGGTAAGTAESPLSGTLTIVGGGTAAGTVEDPSHQLSGTLTITGGGTAAGVDVAPLSGTLAITGGGTAAGTDVVALAGTLTVTGGGTAAGTVEDPSHQLSGTLSITGGGTAAGTDVAPLTGTLTITGGGTAAGTDVAPLSGTLAIVGGGTAAGTVEDFGHALSGTLTLVGGGTAAGTVEAPLSATLTIVGGGTAAGADVAPLSGTLTITGGGTAAGTVEIVGAFAHPLFGFFRPIINDNRIISSRW